MALVTYVKTGISGYGPDLDPEDTGSTTVHDLCYVIREELDHAADWQHDVASGYAEQGEYEDAWNTRELADALGTLAMNLDYDRREKAPMYANGHGDLDATMRDLIAQHFPLDLDIAGNVRLYVWEADDDQS